MAKPNLRNNKKKKTGLLSNIDIMKGFTAMANTQDIWSMQPLQCIPLEDKGEEWIKWNANWHEQIALKELPKKAKRLQKLYNLAAGILDKNDYIVNPENELSDHLGIVGAKDDEYDLLRQFFPIVPNIIQVFLGEQMKREKAVIVQADDPESMNESLTYKEGLVRQILEQRAIEQKQLELIKLGITPENAQTQSQFAQEMQKAQQLIEAELEFKKYRTLAEKWAQAFIDKFGSKYYFDEMELWAFCDSLIADEAIFALTMREDDFVCDRLNPISTYVNISPNIRYYSKANSITNIEFMTLPDVVNTFRNDLTEDQITALERIHYSKISTGINILGQDRNDQLYNTAQSYDWNMQQSVNMQKDESARQVGNLS
jgi:hypothetical protein